MSSLSFVRFLFFIFYFHSFHFAFNKLTLNEKIAFEQLLNLLHRDETSVAFLEEVEEKILRDFIPFSNLKNTQQQ
jgi:hypothetical protein